MKKLIYFVIFLFMLAIASPRIDGLYFKQKFLQFVSSVNQNSRIKLSIREYRLGWLSSTIKLNTTPDFTIDVTVKHGPILFDKLHHKFIFASAYINSTMHLPKKMNATKLTAETLITFNKHLVKQMNFQISIPLMYSLVESYYQKPKHPPVIIKKPIHQADQASIEKFNNTIISLMMQGKLPLKTSMQIISLQSNNTSPTQFNAYIAKLKLNTKINEQITRFYPQTITQPVIATPIPAEPSSMDLAKVAISEWEKQGYLIQKDDNYIVSISSS